MRTKLRYFLDTNWCVFCYLPKPIRTQLRMTPNFDNFISRTKHVCWWPDFTTRLTSDTSAGCGHYGPGAVVAHSHKKIRASPKKPTWISIYSRSASRVITHINLPSSFPSSRGVVIISNPLLFPSINQYSGVICAIILSKLQCHRFWVRKIVPFLKPETPRKWRILV